MARDTMKTIKKRVEFILRDYPATRDSDKELYIRFYERHYPSIVYFNDILNYGTPSPESIGRAKRKVCEDHPEYSSSAEIQAIKDEKQIEMTDFALNG